MVGEYFESKNFGKMLVVEKLTSSRYKVVFQDTGTETVATAANIKSGSVKDRYSPVVAGVGFLAGADTTTNPKIYARWKRMLQACYDPLHVDYHANGAAGITVDPRWHNFENYEKDILKRWEAIGSPEKYRIFRKGSVFNLENILMVKQK